MMSIDRRVRPRFVLGCAAVFGCLLVPPRYASSFGISWVSVFAPAQKALARGGRLLAFSLDDIASWRHTAAENRRLREQVHRLTAELAHERAIGASREASLRTLGAFRRYQQERGQHAVEEVEEAEVVGEGIGAQRGIVFIDRGSNDRVQPGMTAISGKSIVGTVRAVAPSVSAVLLITSSGARFDGQVVETGEPGVVVGNGDGTMTMKYVAQVRPPVGSSVVTRGRDGSTPAHFLLGQVIRAERAPGALAYDIVIRPACDLDRLAGVVVARPAVSAADFPRLRAGHGADD